jgi:hypothetical protein
MPELDRNSKTKKRIGWIVSILPALMLIFSGVMKLVGGSAVAEGFAHLGWPASLAVPLGILEIGCAVLYLVPATSVLGAILLTAYMGGAVATHVRLGEAFVIQVLVGVLFWLGLYLRDARLRALLPLRSAL